MKTQKFKLPFLIEVHDYHSFSFVEGLLRDLTGNNKIKFAEIVFEDENDGNDDFDDNQTRVYWKKKTHIVPEESSINDVKWFYLAVVYEGKQPDFKDILKAQLVTWG